MRKSNMKTVVLWSVTLLLCCYSCCWHFAQAAVLSDGSKMDCDHYNENNCTQLGDCDTKVEHCPTEPGKTPSCYVVWQVEKETGNIKIKMKGCFSDAHECNQTECITQSEPRPENIHFCCCKGYMCNTHQKYLPTTTEATTQVPKEKTASPANTIYFALIIVGFCTGVVVMGVCHYRLYFNPEKPAHYNDTPRNDNDMASSSPLLNTRPIQLLELKASGRFGNVWHGKLVSQDVAIKRFRMQEKDSYNTEVEIYKLPRMRHPNILEFLGYEKHNDAQPEYWLISVYHHNGSLCDYLKSHTISWPELCKIAESMSQGLAHLHEEIPASKTEGLKPSIAHRDFKSKNVLLKGDLTACIADFGLAMIFQPGKPCGDTHGQVGTRLYMAPEVLEGAINFNRDAFLRIDVYACGLVLWEMVARCDAVGPPGEYQQPFEAELGQRPTLDEVQDAVVMKKQRPRILNSWRSHSGLSVICDTMEECWDHDAEARLSSSCVMERFSQLNKYPAKQLLIENNTSNCIEDAKETTNCL